MVDWYQVAESKQSLWHWKLYAVPARCWLAVTKISTIRNLDNASTNCSVICSALVIPIRTIALYYLHGLAPGPGSHLSLGPFRSTAKTI